MNKQEIFDTAVRGLASQGWEQALDIEGFCTGLAPDGKRCALGHLAELCGLAPERSIYPVACKLEQYVGLGRFSQLMVACHDDNRVPLARRDAFIRLCRFEALTWPSDVPQEGEL